MVTPASPGLKAIRVNGTVLSYIDSISNGRSSGRAPIVFVHGTLGNLHEWRNQIAVFAGRQRAISYSRRYHQPNPQIDDGQQYSPQLHAADLAAFLRALNLGPVDLVGSSYGGAVVLELARQNPKMIHALILAEPAVNLFGSTADLKVRNENEQMTINGLDSARVRFARGDSVGALRAVIDATLGVGSFEAAPKGARRYFTSQMFELSKEMSVPANVWLSPLTCADLRPVTMPVLLLRGEKTLDIYGGMIDMFRRCLPQSRTDTIPAVGHHLVENSASFNKKVMAFLNTLRQ